MINYLVASIITISIFLASLFSLNIPNIKESNELLGVKSGFIDGEAYTVGVRLYNGSYYNKLAASSSLASDVTWYLPTSDGSANQVLKTDGAGNLGWATGAIDGSGTSTQIAYFSDADTLTSSVNFVIMSDGTVLATSTQFINATTTNLAITGLATPAGAVLAVSPSGNIIATTTGAGAGTVTSVDMTVPTGLAIAGNPITTSGTLALTFAGGYSIPLTASTTNGQTAYNWGDHATAGYMTLTTWFATTSAPQLTSLANLATVGTITTGIWNGTDIDISDYTNLAAGRSLTLSGDSIEADAELYTANFDFIFSTSTISTTTGAIIKKLPLAFTITEVSGFCKGGTTTIMIDERAATTPKTAGTDIFNQAIAFGDYVATTTFANAGIASGAYVNLDIDGYFSGTPSWCSISIKGTKDD